MKPRSKTIPSAKISLVRPAVVGVSALLLSAVAGLAQEVTPAATPEVTVPPAKVNVDQGNLQRNPAGGPFTSFAPIIDKVAPSVVTIYTSKTVKRDPHANMFDEDTLRRFFGNRLPNPHNFQNPGRIPPTMAAGATTMTTTAPTTVVAAATTPRKRVRDSAPASSSATTARF